MSLPRPAQRGAAAGLLAALTLLALGPVLLSRGSVLVADMTFVPDQPWKGAWLGLDGGVPRAVPADALVWVLDEVLPFYVASRLLLVSALFGAGLGAMRAVRVVLPAAGACESVSAAALYLWNPYVFERLAIGHWGLLLGYAALPWAAAAALRVRSGQTSSLGVVVVAAGVAAIGSPTGGIVVSAVALGLAAGRAVVRAWVLLAAALVVVNLPWLVPALVNDVGVSDPDGITAFAARGDTPFGLWGSLLGFGGVWKTSAAPGDRHVVVLAGAMMLLVVAALVALARAGQRRLLTLGGVSLLIAGLPATGPGGTVARWLVTAVPGAGLLRDSQKWVMPLVLVGCLGVAFLVHGLTRSVRRGWWPMVVASLVPVILLPSLAWGLAGRLDPVDLPAEWNTVRGILHEQPPSERRTAVLPWSAYQRLPFNQNRAALDPAIRYLPGQILASTALAVGSAVVDGDDTETAIVATADGADLQAALRRQGARFALIERTAAGGASVTVPEGRLLHDGKELTLVDLGGEAVLRRSPQPAAIVAADLLALAVLLGAFGFVVTRCVGDHTKRRRVR